MTWKRTKDELPPEDTVVETKVDLGNGVRNHRRLFRRGELWYEREEVGYVVWRPTHWREVQDGA